MRSSAMGFWLALGGCGDEACEGARCEPTTAATEPTDPSVEPPDPDTDGDGFLPPDDCGEGDASVHPGATDTVGDALDQNCDGVDGVDGDGDGAPSVDSGGDDCDDGDASLTPFDADSDLFSTCAGDCDDADAGRWPDNAETCNGIDDDCDLQVDLGAGGEAPCARAESFGAWDVVDLLLLIDDSCSMADDQAAFSEAVDELVTPLVGVAGLHAGVITTDTDDPDKSGKLQQLGQVRWVDEGTPLDEAVAFLAANVVQGTSGSGNEQGRDAIRLAVDTQGSGYNLGFFRDEAQLAVVVLSDEPDLSAITVGAFEAWYDTVKPSTDLLGFHAVVSVGACGGLGADYITLAGVYQGQVFAVCDSDLQPEMATLGAALVPPPLDVFALAEVPVVATLSVTVTEVGGAVVVPVVGLDWDYDAVANAVVFSGLGYVPTSGSVVEILYDAVP